MDCNTSVVGDGGDVSLSAAQKDSSGFILDFLQENPPLNSLPNPEFILNPSSGQSYYTGLP